MDLTESPMIREKFGLVEAAKPSISSCLEGLGSDVYEMFSARIIS